MLCPIYRVYHDTAKKYNNTGASKDGQSKDRSSVAPGLFLMRYTSSTSYQCICFHRPAQSAWDP